MNTISVTKISTYQDCPRKYWYSYVMKVKTPKSEGFYFGSAVHAGLEDYYNGKDPMQGVSNALFGKKASIGEEAKEGVDPYKLHKEAKRIFEIYPDQATYFKPVLVEYFFKTQLIHPETKEKLPVLFNGKVDLITADGKVVDHKTGGGVSDYFMERGKLQAFGYTYAYLMKFGKMPDIFVWNFIIRGNTRREPRVETRTLKVTLGDVCFFFDTCKQVYEAIVRGETANCPNTGGCRFCQYKDICPMKG